MALNCASSPSIAARWSASASCFRVATSFALAGALHKIESEFGKPLMVFTGKQTIDGDTAQVGPGIAKRLGLNQLTYVAKIVDLDPELGNITVERRAEGGVQILSTRLPVLITMLEGVNEIRRGTLDDALRAARAKIVTWSAADAGITDLTQCGLRGSPTIVKKVFAPSPRAEKAHQIPAADVPMEALAETVIAEIFKRQPALEGDLMRFSAGQ